MARDVETLFARGKEAADHGNYDYAITIFRDVLRIDPNHRNSRIALRGCEMEKFRTQGGGGKARFAAVMKGLGPLLTTRLSAGNPKKVIDACEQFLVNDPTNIGVLRRLAAAYTKLGNLEAAADTLEFARQRNPRHIGVLRQLGEVLYQQGQYDKSVRCFQEITAIKPEDHEAGDRGREISAEAHLRKSKMDHSQSFRESLRDEGTARSLERENRMSVTEEERDEEIAKLLAAVEATPQDYEAHQRLGDAYFRSSRYQEAELAYRKAFEIGKRWPAREKMGNSRLRHLEKIEREAVAEVEASGRSAQAIMAVREAKKRRLEFAIKEFETRRKQHPTDMKLAWQLGLYYFEAGGEEGVQNAIQQFQQAMSNPGIKVRALHMLGRCFAQNAKTLDMAKEQFSKALQGVEDPQTDLGKSLMYELAALSEKMGNAPEALTWYKKIFSVDAGYRDVSKKIQELG